MKALSWNVNGLRACIGKDFWTFFEREQPDLMALQETKLQQDQAPAVPDGYLSYWNCAEKKGYSGTAVFTRHEPLAVRYGLGIPEHDREGRVITLTYPAFHFVTAYTPNSQDGLKRLAYRMTWEDVFRAYLMELDKEKPVVVCGDLNVAHREIDLKNPKTNRMNAGFTDEERAKFTLLLESGFVDSFRYFYPDAAHVYSWWSYRFHARENNSGWRIDYFLTSERMRGSLRQASILSDVYGSDHCPVELVWEGTCASF